MYDTTIAAKLLKQLESFLGRISPHFHKPVARFIGDMMYGIMAEKDEKLASIVRALKEKTTPKKVEDRLSRMLSSEGLERGLHDVIAAERPRPRVLAGERQIAHERGRAGDRRVFPCRSPPMVRRVAFSCSFVSRSAFVFRARTDPEDAATRRRDGEDRLVSTPREEEVKAPGAVFSRSRRRIAAAAEPRVRARIFVVRPEGPGLCGR